MITLKINNIETNYKIDKQGNVLNSKRNKILGGSIKNGYKTVKLTISGKKKDYLIHRLVAMTFIDNPCDLPQVNHKDGNRLNNDADNLEWISASDNIKHSFSIGRKPRQRIIAIDEQIFDSKEWQKYLNTSYYISKHGRCANIKTGKFLNASTTNDGYLRYSLYINEKSINILAHCLVYNTFNPSDTINKNEQINHIDGDKKNNSIDNLEKVTNIENMMHSYYNLKQNIIKIRKYDLDDNFISEYESISQAARDNNYNISGISQAANGKIKTYKGFVWKKV